MYWRWFYIVLFWLFPTAISAQSRYAPTLQRACLDRVNAELSLQLSAHRDTCSFLKYRLWGRTDAFASFEVLDEATTFNLLNWNVILPNKKKWELYITAHFNCGTNDSFISNTIFIDDTPPSYVEPDSISIDFASQRVIAGWTNPPETDILGYSLFKVDGAGNNLLIDEQNVLSYTFETADFDGAKSGNRLAIAAYDSCRNGGIISAYHSPILASAATNSNYLCDKGIRVNWTPYVGWAVDHYHVFVIDKNTGTVLASEKLTATTTFFDFVLPYLDVTLDIYVRAQKTGSAVTSTSNRVSLFVADFPKPSKRTSLYFASVKGNQEIELEGFSESGDSCEIYYQEGNNPWLITRTYNTSPGTFRFSHTSSRTSTNAVRFYVKRYNYCGEIADSSLIISTIHLKENNGLLDWNHNEQWSQLSGTADYYIEKQEGSNWAALGSTDLLNFTLPPYGSYWVRIRGESNLWVSEGKNYTYSNPVFVDLGYDSSQYDTLLIPNVFSPDGNNPIFKISNPAIAEGESELTIFNRWGQKIWEGDGLVGWDGYINSQPVPDGTYVYHFKALYRRKRVEKAGTVLLLR